MTDEEIKALQDELESTRGELQALKQEKEVFSTELETKDARITELEQALANSEEKLAKVNNSLAEAVSSYKSLVIQSNPGVISEVIIGDTIEAINQSLESAKTLVIKVRKDIEAEIASAKVPAGAPGRTPPDLSALSPQEKIQYAIGGKR